MRRTDRVRRRPCDYSLDYRRRERARTNDYLHRVTCWIVYYRDELTAHLRTVDDSNISDAELKTTNELNAKIKAVEKEYAVLKNGKRKEADKCARRLRDEASLLITRLPPPRLVPAPPVGEGHNDVQREVQNILRMAARIGRRREDA